MTSKAAHTWSPQRGETIRIFHHSFMAGGGKERYGLGLAATFIELGYPVAFYARSGDRALAKRMGIELHELPVARFPRKLRDYRFYRRIETLRPRLSGPQITLSRVRARDLLISGGTHRGYLSRARKVSGPFDWLQIWMERQCYAAARVIIAHSDLIAADLVARYAVPKEKVVVLYPAVGDSFSPAASNAERMELRARLGLPADKVVLLFPSMGHSRKGLRPVAEALRALGGSVTLAVAGKPPAGMKWPFVQYLGYVQDMVAAYRAADFTILGSSYEPFGLVGPESILCGTRLIFEENIGCLAAIKPEAVFPFSVWNPDSIGRAVSAAIELARQGRHRLPQPAQVLKYDPSPHAHAQDVLRVMSA